MPTELQVTVPDIGDYSDVPVIEVLVKPGDAVDKDAALVTLESDKATLDVPAPAAGVVKSISLKVGDKVSQGSAVLVLEVGGGAVATAANPDTRSAEGPSPAEGRGSGSPLPPGETARSTGEGQTSKSPPVAASTAVAIPDIGDYKDVPVIEVLVKDGDTVEKDATLLVLESDKATLDVPAPVGGVVSGFALKVGDKVSQGTPICTLRGSAAEMAEAPAVAPPAATDVPAAAAPGNLGIAPETWKAQPPAEPVQARSDGHALPYASPSVRKFARELGVDLAAVKGSGPKGRIVQDDVQAFVKQALAAPKQAAAAAAGGMGIPPIPTVDFAQFGPIETKPLARIRKLSAAHLHRSWLNIPAVTQTDEADITELEAFRKQISDENAKSGSPKLTLLPFVMKAVAKMLEAYPEFCSSLSPDGESLIFKQYKHIGFAADTPNGLVVPVVRDVDRKTVTQLAAETGELASRARSGKLKPDEMRGGVFSISSLGGIGGSHFSPIVNAPEVGILGVSKSVVKPVWDGKAFAPRLMVPLSLSYDHRVIDGAYAARAIVLLGKLLSDLRRLAL